MALRMLKEEELAYRQLLAERFVSFRQDRLMKADNILCKVCMERESNMVVIGCGHFCLCEPCANQLRDCPICRATNIETVKIKKER